MASAAKQQNVAVYGYIRRNFNKECMVEAIIKLVIHYYKIDAGNLYAFGVNSNGEMGIYQEESGDNKTPHYILRPTICPPFDQNNCVDIASSGMRSLAVDTFGNLYAFGSMHRPLPIWAIPSQFLTAQSLTDAITCHTWAVPRLIKLNHRIISVAVGGKDLIALTQFGRVLTLEYNAENKNFDARCMDSIAQHQMIQISAGHSHCGAISNDGKLFLWGANDFGQIGIGNQESSQFVQLPMHVKLMDGKKESAVEQIECGGDHCLAISKAGLIFSWGCGEGTRQHSLRIGALGHGNNENVNYPKVVEALRDKKIVHITTGTWHSLCIDENGNVYSWGYGGHSNLGHGAGRNGNEAIPRIIQYFVDNAIKVKWCSAGPATSEIISADDRLFSFGVNHLSCNHPVAQKLGMAPFESQIINVPKERAIGAPVGKVLCASSCTFFITGSRIRS